MSLNSSEYLILVLWFSILPAAVFGVVYASLLNIVLSCSYIAGVFVFTLAFDNREFDRNTLPRW